MRICTIPHIKNNCGKFTPSFKKYFNKDFGINSLSNKKREIFIREGFLLEAYFKNNLQVQHLPKSSPSQHVPTSCMHIRFSQNIWESKGLKNINVRNKTTSVIIALALTRESAKPYATVTPMLEPARAGFTWNMY